LTVLFEIVMCRCWGDK